MTTAPAISPTPPSSPKGSERFGAAVTPNRRVEAILRDPCGVVPLRLFGARGGEVYDRWNKLVPMIEARDDLRSFRRQLERMLLNGAPGDEVQAVRAFVKDLEAAYQMALAQRSSPTWAQRLNSTILERPTLLSQVLSALGLRGRA